MRLRRGINKFIRIQDCRRLAIVKWAEFIFEAKTSERTGSVELKLIFFNLKTDPVPAISDFSPMSEITIKLNLREEDTISLLLPLEEALLMEPKTLHLELVGPGVVSPDRSLVLHDMLRKRRLHTHLITYARSCLIDSAVLIWLCVDIRKMRADAWIQLDSIKRLSKDRPWRKSVNLARPDKPMIGEPSWMTDYRTAARYMNEYLPLEEIADRPIFYDELAELGLIESADGIDQLDVLLRVATKDSSSESEEEERVSKDVTSIEDLPTKAGQGD